MCVPVLILFRFSYTNFSLPLSYFFYAIDRMMHWFGFNTCDLRGGHLAPKQRAPCSKAPVQRTHPRCKSLWLLVSLLKWVIACACAFSSCSACACACAFVHSVLVHVHVHMWVNACVCKYSLSSTVCVCFICAIVCLCALFFVLFLLLFFLFFCSFFFSLFFSNHH